MHALTLVDLRVYPAHQRYADIKRLYLEAQKKRGIPHKELLHWGCYERKYELVACLVKESLKKMQVTKLQADPKPAHQAQITEGFPEKGAKITFCWAVRKIWVTFYRSGLRLHFKPRSFQFPLSKCSELCIETSLSSKSFHLYNPLDIPKQL